MMANSVSIPPLSITARATAPIRADSGGSASTSTRAKARALSTSVNSRASAGVNSVIGCRNLKRISSGVKSPKLRRSVSASPGSIGRKLIARPILPGDADTLRRSFGDLTPEEIRFRFLHPITELTPAHARELVDVDRARAFALVLVEALPPERARIGAVARAIIDEGGNDAEFAIIVGREIGGFGLGAYLLKRIAEWSAKKGMRTLYGDVMVENQRMLRLARRLGFSFAMHPVEPQIVRIRRSLRRGASA